MSQFCLSPLLLALLPLLVTSYDTHWEKALWKLTEQKRREAPGQHERATRNELFSCGGENPFDLSQWVDSSLHAFPVVKENLYKDIQFRTVPHIGRAFEELVYDMVENSQWADLSECIYLTWSMSYLTFELEKSLHIAKVVIASTASHALLHLTDPTACEEQLIKGDNIAKWYEHIYAPLMNLKQEINELVMNSGYGQSIIDLHQQVFQPVAQLVHMSDPHHLTAQQVVQKYMEELCKQLENPDLYQFVEPTCPVLEHGLHDVISEQLNSLRTNLELAHMEASLKNHLPTECHVMVDVFTEEMSHDPRHIRLPLDILTKTLSLFEESHSQGVDKMEVWRKLMRQLNMLDLNSGIEADALVAHILSAHLALTSPVPIETALIDIRAQQLEILCLELFSQVVYTFDDSCLDYKLMAPLVGIVHLKQLDLTTTNFHFLSVSKLIWRLLKSQHPHLDDSIRQTLVFEFFEFVKTMYSTKLKHFLTLLQDKSDEIPAFYKAKSVVIDSILIVTKDKVNNGTLEDLIEELVLIVAHSFGMNPHHQCPDTGNIYTELKGQIMHFISQMEEISPEEIDKFTESLLTSIPVLSLETKSTLENITKEGLTLLSSFILEDIRLLAASLHDDKHHSRVILSNFIGAHLASSLFNVIWYSTTTKTTTKPSPPPDVNESLQEMVRWQHHVINSFFSGYMKGLQDMTLNVALVPSMNMCEISPSLCEL